MKTIKSFGIISFSALFYISVAAFAQEKPDTSGTNHQMMMKHDHQMMHTMIHDSSSRHNMHGMNMSKDSSNYKMNDNEMMSSKKSPLVREGVIDLKAIDKNKDGKVYEDMMDYNVISDKPGKCPLCGMTLKEISIKKAKQNLKANGFEVK
jgi:hypothetical protein